VTAENLGAWLNDPAAVRDQYRSEVGLKARSSLYEQITGAAPAGVAFEAVAEVGPRRFLEVGCGAGEFAARVQQELGASVVAIDLSERMVELAVGAGVDARIGDVQQLPFADGDFDCAAANWMLYHVPELDRALAELARGLRPGGRLVAVTNGRDHLIEVWRLVGAAEARVSRQLTFSAENGSEVLRRHFRHVERRDAGGTVVIRDRDAIDRYIRSIKTWAPFAENLPETLEIPVVATRATSVFVATV
jgi:SAM-dependent methyltransferase